MTWVCSVIIGMCSIAQPLDFFDNSTLIASPHTADVRAIKRLDIQQSHW